MTSEEFNNLEVSLEAYERDALRYRWLRDKCIAPQHTWILEAPAEMWDEAIDSAMGWL